jgi:hypothetical protein
VARELAVGLSFLASSWPTPLALTLLLASEQGNLFDKACVRWIGRFALEVPGLPADVVQLALSALLSLRHGRAAGAHALAELFEEVGRADLAAVAEQRLERRG